MDAIDAILSRRSIRQYTTDPVPEKVIDELLAVAMSAPSASNQQPWHFVVISERGLLEAISQVHSYANMLKDASVAIAVCGDLQLETDKGFWVQDCSAATQNILLAAHARGLGAVWVGIYPIEESVTFICTLLGLPEHVIPLSLVSLGYPAGKKPGANRYNPARIHHNQW